MSRVVEPSSKGTIARCEEPWLILRLEVPGWEDLLGRSPPGTSTLFPELADVDPAASRRGSPCGGTYGDWVLGYRFTNFPGSRYLIFQRQFFSFAGAWRVFYDASWTCLLFLPSWRRLRAQVRAPSVYAPPAGPTPFIPFRRPFAPITS